MPMARKAGSKNKDLKAKVEDLIDGAEALKAESPEQAAEIKEAVEELKDILEERPKKEKVLVGKHPVTGEPVYI
jgi:topoisomerase IA-like protein